MVGVELSLSHAECLQRLGQNLVEFGALTTQCSKHAIAVTRGKCHRIAQHQIGVVFTAWAERVQSDRHLLGECNQDSNVHGRQRGQAEHGNALRKVVRALPALQCGEAASFEGSCVVSP